MSSTDKLTDFAIKQFTQLQDSVNHVLPTATKYVLETTSIDCFLNLLVFWALLLIASVLWAIWFKYRKYEDHYSSALNKNVRQLTEGSQAVLVVISAITALTFILQFFSTWYYVGWFHPELYLVHETMAKFI